MLDLIETVNGSSKAEAVEFAKAWLGGDYTKVSEKQLGDANIAINDTEERDGLERQHRAARIWHSSVPLSGAPAQYIRSRGLDLGFTDGELRASPGLPHPEGGTYPCLIGRVSSIAGKGAGIWRVYVNMDGSGKAPVETPKMGLGEVRGGAIRIGGIWPEIGIAEGIETALACRQLIEGKIPVWSAMSSAGIRGLELPDGIERVRIFADNDACKYRAGRWRESAGMSAALALAERLDAEGIQAIIESPPTGMDFLDVLRFCTEMAA